MSNDGDMSLQSLLYAISGEHELKECPFCHKQTDDLFLGLVMWEKKDENFEKPWKWPHAFYFDQRLMCRECFDSHEGSGLPEWAMGLSDLELMVMLLEYQELELWSLIHDNTFGVCNVHNHYYESLEEWKHGLNEEYRRAFDNREDRNCWMSMAIYSLAGGQPCTMEDVEELSGGWERAREIERQIKRERERDS